MKKVLIAKINSVFGIKGQVKIISFCKNPCDIEKYQIFDKNNRQFKITISNKNKTVIGSSGSGDAILIASIEGVADRNEAETLRGVELFTDRKNFKELDGDEFYQVDLIGLDVIDDDGKNIGKVTNVMDFGAGTMLEVEFKKVNSDRGLEKIESFPFKDEFFPDVNMRDGTIRIVLPEIVKMEL